MYRLDRIRGSLAQKLRDIDPQRVFAHSQRPVEGKRSVAHMEPQIGKGAWVSLEEGRRASRSERLNVYDYGVEQCIAGLFGAASLPPT